MTRPVTSGRGENLIRERTNADRCFSRRDDGQIPPRFRIWTGECTKSSGAISCNRRVIGQTLSKSAKHDGCRLDAQCPAEVPFHQIAVSQIKQTPSVVFQPVWFDHAAILRATLFCNVHYRMKLIPVPHHWKCIIVSAPPNQIVVAKTTYSSKSLLYLGVCPLLNLK